MRWYRIWAMLRRYLYLYPRSVPRLMDIFYWPIIELLIWGFLTVYLSQIEANLPNFLILFVGALIFWNIIHRSQQAVSIAFLEEVWERNLLNIFTTPLTISEFLASTLLLGVVRILIIATTIGLFAFLLFHFNIFVFGFYLVPFVFNLFLFGWIFGLITTAIILRFGQSAQVLAFGLTIIIQPIAAVFYPVSILPAVLQPISYALPVTYIFEGMRIVVLQGNLPLHLFVSSLLLNLVWLIFSLLLFLRMFDWVREKGLLLKLD